jgi:hypothetical protein
MFENRNIGICVEAGSFLEECPAVPVHIQELKCFTVTVGRNSVFRELEDADCFQVRPDFFSKVEPT